MSRRCCGGGYTGGITPAFTGGFTGTNNCICSLPTLVILILIVLQFSRRNRPCHDEYECEDRCGHDQIGNGLLFIIALFFLSCSGCGARY